MTEDNSKHNMFLYVLLLGCLIVVASSLYFFYYKKDYNFIVETSCNPEAETCFYRDCNNPDDCPPNGFSYYNQYKLKASDYKACTDEDCTLACTTRVIDCLKTECTDNDIDDGKCVESLTEENLN